MYKPTRGKRVTKNEHGCTHLSVASALPSAFDGMMAQEGQETHQVAMLATTAYALSL